VKQHILNGMDVQARQFLSHPRTDALEHRHGKLIEIVGYFRQTL
jgi:hypothetical protein